MSPEQRIPPTVMEMLADEERRESRFTRWALGVAVMLHVAVFAVHWPTFADAGRDDDREKPRVFVVRQFEFKPPPPQEERVNIKKPPKKIPIPDPTPNDPEPVRYEEPQMMLDDLEIEGVVLGDIDIPEEPAPKGPVIWTRAMTEPRKVFAPSPHYPEAARRVHLQGTVILECVIDREGKVASVKVLRPQPLGMSEAAVEAVRQWTFEPATLDGRPMDVIYNLAVHFRLQ